MKPGQVLRSEIPLGKVLPNIGTLFLNNRERVGSSRAFAQREQGKYRYWTWNDLVEDILKTSTFLTAQGLKPGDRIGIIAGNSYDRLVFEMAVMSSGMVSVPIFAGYPKDLMGELLAFADVRALATDDFTKIRQLSKKDIPKSVVALRNGAGVEPSALPGASAMPQILRDKKRTTEAEELWRKIKGQDLCLIMYTSGTSNFPKGVQLTHGNILSQQRALEILWKPEPAMHFLCYLPWHHSFGGLFERFFALSSGGCLAIDDSAGKDVRQLLKNFSEIKPHVYFSVPKIYQEIVAQVLANPELEGAFFHPDLRYIFTAAAPLPLSTSNIFKAKGVPVVEGWGLTETSPCCTLTERSLDRQPGVVGFAIPGVEVKLGEENEILVRGPNIMRGYFRNEAATRAVLDQEGWFATGDLGEITSAGLKIVSRKDRMFKLSNGEKVFPAVIEENVKTQCKFVKYAYAFGKGQSHPFLLVFPNMELLKASASSLDQSDCKYPCSLNDFAKCLGECITRLNGGRARFERIQKAVIVRSELLIDNNELTPSFKLIPRTVEERYRAYLRVLEENTTLPDDAFIVDIVDEQKRRTK